MKASTAIAPGSGNHDTYALHLLLFKEANKSILKGPKVSSTSRKALCDKDHSVSGSAILDSASAITFCTDGM